tara:strand:+ start:1229 stop:1615 length:387 start_codon:yes stop_codon:yes gene_type:complete
MSEKNKKKVNKKYVPESLSKSDKKKQIKSIEEGKNRPKVDYKTKRSSFVKKFEDKYNHKITAKSWIDKNLLKSEGQNLIIKKGEGAYYSGGSRPNVSARQWGLARLASVLIGGPARKIDKKIYDKYKI